MWWMCWRGRHVDYIIHVMARTLKILERAMLELSWPCLEIGRKDMILGNDIGFWLYSRKCQL